MPMDVVHVGRVCVGVAHWDMFMEVSMRLNG